MTKMPLAEHNNVVKALPSDRTDQSFSIAVLPWGTRRRRSIANAHGSKSSDEDLAIGPISITDQSQNLSSTMPHNQQAVDQTK